MDEFQHHVALPRLYGAPAYARPAVPVAHTPRPLDLDDLPIVAHMTDDDMALLARLPELAGGVPGSPGTSVAIAEPPMAEEIGSRAFSIRTFADRIRRPRR